MAIRCAVSHSDHLSTLAFQRELLVHIHILNIRPCIHVNHISGSSCIYRHLNRGEICAATIIHSPGLVKFVWGRQCFFIVLSKHYQHTSIDLGIL